MTSDEKTKEQLVKMMHDIVHGSISNMEELDGTAKMDDMESKRIKVQDPFVSKIKTAEKKLQKLIGKENKYLVKQSQGGFSASAYETSLKKVQEKKEEKLNELEALREEQAKWKAEQQAEQQDEMTNNIAREVSAIMDNTGVSPMGKTPTDDDADMVAPVLPGDDSTVSFPPIEDREEYENSSNTEVESSIDQDSVEQPTLPKEMNSIWNSIWGNVPSSTEDRDGIDIPDDEMTNNIAREVSAIMDNTGVSHATEVPQNPTKTVEPVVAPTTSTQDNVGMETLNNQFNNITNEFNDSMKNVMQQMMEAFNTAMLNVQNSSKEALAKKQEELDGVKAENKTLRDENQQLQLTKTTLVDRVSMYVQEVSEKNKTIDSQQTKIDDQEKQIGELTTTVGEKDSLIAGLEGKINDLTKKLYEESVAKQKAELAAKHAKDETEKVTSQFNNFVTQIQGISAQLQNNTVTSTPEEEAYTYQK